MNKPEHRADSGDEPAPPRLRLKLTSAGDVRRELARLYREARSGRVETQDASRLGNLLAILGRLIETSDLERRLEALEGRTGEQT